MENKKAETAIRALDSKKGIDIELMKVADLTVLTEYFVLATGTSNTHIRSLADEVEFKMREAGFEPLRIEGRATGWILQDYGDVIVHVFSAEQRAQYALEKLWGDAERVDISEIVTEN
ncbi:MAG: ribosome silencing factor [Clostridia bacterium]|nr:ribosome silencing factor [Clostridia bacterium]